MSDKPSFDQRDQIIDGPQINIAIGDRKSQSQGRDLNATGAFLTASLSSQENGIARIEIKNVGKTIARKIRISFAGRTIHQYATGKGCPFPEDAGIPAGESVFIPVDCPGWKEIYVDMRWTDDSTKNNNWNKSYIPLIPI